VLILILFDTSSDMCLQLFQWNNALFGGSDNYLLADNRGTDPHRSTVGLFINQ